MPFPPTPSSPDNLTIKDLSLHLPHGLGPSAFNLLPPPPCPAILNVEISLDPRVVPSSTGDDTMAGLGLNYSSTTNAIRALCEGGTKWASPRELLDGIAGMLWGFEVVTAVKASVGLPRGVLPAERVVYTATYARPEGTAHTAEKTASGGDDTEERGDAVGRSGLACTIKALRVRTIIGLHAHERRTKQWLEVDVTVKGYDEATWSHVYFAEEVYEWVEKSSYGTIEALIDCLAKYLVTSSSLLNGKAAGEPEVELSVKKPSALAFAVAAFTITRTRSYYSPSTSASAISGGSGSKSGVSADVANTSFAPSSSGHRVFVAIGSNIGDRIGHLRKAVDELDSMNGVNVTRTSRLYESEPMYVEDQDRFINGVIELQTTLSPLDLLRVLKKTERSVGRTKTFRNGPRVVDLDLLMYGDEVVRIGQVEDKEDEDGVGWLECPHPRIAEREFVLRPLADLIPTVVIPTTIKTVRELLASLMSSSKPSLAPIIPFPFPALPLRLDGLPKIMQIFNATPDSFSDGDASHVDTAAALESITKLFDSPIIPDILDIGGMSTRPKSTPCTEQEELDRVVPLIQAIRASSNPTIRSIPISIDTYRPEVAMAAIKAGASCINDVRGGAELGMKETMAKLGVPVVLMHSRGDSTTMMSPTVQDYSACGGIAKGVQVELGQRVTGALEAGVRGWDIVLDPGLGFAKNPADNLTLLRRVNEISGNGQEMGLTGYPVLIGGSRKGFVGKVIGREKKEEAGQRGFGDAAVVGWCAHQGVDILRVHDGRGMGEVLKMWAAIKGEQE